MNIDLQNLVHKSRANTSLIFLSLALFIFGCSSAFKRGFPNTAPPRQPGGNLLLVGGGKRPDEVMRFFVKLAGGKASRIVILPLASGDSVSAGGFYASEFEKFGAGETRIIHINDRRDAGRKDYIDTIEKATGVWFGGGDQKRIVQRLVGTPLLEAIFRMKAVGGVVGGTSAGTACQSEIILPGDAGDEAVIRAGNIPTMRGLGLAKGVIMDQHFVARRRQNRLISVLIEHPGHIGLAVDESTAVWIKPDQTLEVFGNGQVFIYDMHDAKILRDDKKIGASNIRLHVLIAGQRYDLKRREIISAHKTAKPTSADQQ